MSSFNVTILAEDDTELEVEVDGVGRILQVWRIRDNGKRRRYGRRLTDDELEEVGEMAGFTVEQDDE